MTNHTRPNNGDTVAADRTDPCASCLHGATHHDNGTPTTICTMTDCPGCTGYSRSTTL